jgi:hypothetical protein
MRFQAIQEPEPLLSKGEVGDIIRHSASDHMRLNAAESFFFQ